MNRIERNPLLFFVYKHEKPVGINGNCPFESSVAMASDGTARPHSRRHLVAGRCQLQSAGKVAMAILQIAPGPGEVSLPNVVCVPIVRQTSRDVCVSVVWVCVGVCVCVCVHTCVRDH